MSFSHYQIKKQSWFDDSLREAVPDAERAAEIEQGIRFAVRHFPDQGKRTGIRSPVEVFAWPIVETDRNPPLVVYYCFGGSTILLMSVKVADTTPE